MPGRMVVGFETEPFPLSFLLYIFLCLASLFRSFSFHFCFPFLKVEVGLSSSFGDPFHKRQQACMPRKVSAYQPVLRSVKC